MIVIITPKAQKQYNRLPSTEQAKIKRKLYLLESNPKEGKKLSGEYTELRSMKVWPYRVIYYVESKQNKIFIVTIAHRQGVYRKN